MIRLLQFRLNDDTVGTDKTRPEKMELPLELRREIEALKDSQDEIRDSLAKVAERANPTGDETPGQARRGSDRSLTIVHVKRRNHHHFQES